MPAGDWYGGQIRHCDDGATVPGVLAFDIRRRRAREIAADLGVKRFLWGAPGIPVEEHRVTLFEDDDTKDWRSVRQRALDGLVDMLRAAGNMSALPLAVEESQTSMQKFWQLVSVVLGIAITAGAVQWLAFALLTEDGSTSWIASVIKIAFYPVVIPAVLVGVYLRVLVRRAEDGPERDFTAAEAAANWNMVAPHLLALWFLCYAAIVLLTWVQSVPSADLPFLGRTNGVTTSLIVCLWMLLPIADSHDLESLCKSAFESAVAAAVSIFTIKLSLYLTNLFTDLVWGIVTALLPLEIPERLQQVITFFISFGAEVFFVAVMLGYAWSRTRQHFMRL